MRFRKRLRRWYKIFFPYRWIISPISCPLSCQTPALVGSLCWCQSHCTWQVAPGWLSAQAFWGSSVTWTSHHLPNCFSREWDMSPLRLCLKTTLNRLVSWFLRTNHDSTFSITLFLFSHLRELYPRVRTWAQCTQLHSPEHKTHITLCQMSGEL